MYCGSFFVGCSSYLFKLFFLSKKELSQMFHSFLEHLNSDFKACSPDLKTSSQALESVIFLSHDKADFINGIFAPSMNRTKGFSLKFTLHGT